MREIIFIVIAFFLGYVVGVNAGINWLRSKLLQQISPDEIDKEIKRLEKSIKEKEKKIEKIMKKEGAKRSKNA